MFNKSKVTLILILIGLNIVTYFTARNFERQTQVEYVRSELRSLEMIILNNLRENSLALQRMAKRWKTDEGTPEHRWRSDALSYSSDLIGVTGTGYANKNSVITWIEPSKENQSAIGFQLNTEPKRRIAIEKALETNKAQLTNAIHLKQGGNGYLMLLPVYVKNQHDGFIYLISRYDYYFNNILSNQNYSISISENGQQIYSNNIESDQIAFFESSDPEFIQKTGWKIEISPTKEALANIGNHSTLIVMGVCITLSVLLFLLFYSYTKVITSSRQLKKEESWLRLISNALPQLMWTTKPEGPCDYLSQQWVDYTGIPESQQLDYGWLDQVHADDKERLISAWKQNILTEKTFDIKFRIRRYDGVYHWFHTKAIPIKDNKGNIIRWLGSNTDIDDLQSAIDKANNASRAKADFLTTMSHEIRTPLNGVIGMASLLKNTELNEKQNEYLTYLNESSSLLMNIINEILDLSKIEAGQIDLENLNFNLEEAIDIAIHSVSLAAQNKNLIIEKLLDPKISKWVQGDKTRVQQVLINLINNAIKFTQAGKILIKTNIIENTPQIRIRFSVIDTGIGISKENLSKIFKKFGQIDTVSSNRYEGTGLGLVISKLLVERMGGRIGVESSFENGSCFWFELSFLPGKEETKNSSQTHLPLKKNTKILIAEDNIVNQKVAAAQLKQLGINYIIASNGNEAIEQIKKQPFDLILMDCQMPDLDGYETSKILRKMDYNIPIIAITANAMNEDRDRCLDAGMNDYLTKPTSIEGLESMLNKWLH